MIALAIPAFIFLTAYTVGLANTKNRNAIGWLLLAFVIPVLALILIVVLPPVPGSAPTTVRGA